MIHLGTMNFGGRTSLAESEAIIHRALERGITHFDTANLYNDGASERILGQALRTRRSEVTLATKGGLFRKEGLGKTQIVTAAEQSLKRLATEYIDLYYLHAPDPSTPLDETLEAVASLLSSGKIRSWGVSNFASWQIGDLNLLADAQAIPRPTHSQLLYNLLVRQLDVEYFAFARAHPIHTTIYNPLAGGLLARTPEVGSKPPPGSRFATNPMYPGRYWNDALIELAGQYAALAREESTTPVALAYAWVAHRPGVDSVLVGPGSVAHLDEALNAMALQLPNRVLDRIDQIYRAFVGTDARYAR
jgi:aryl-alcohol dehydrogenase-like predicted oxidoreductase